MHEEKHENYENNKIEISLSEAIELAMARQEDEKRAKRAAEAAELESVEETPAGQKLTWNVTPEEIARINAGDREALDAFYFDEDNLRRIRFNAYRFMRHNPWFKAVVSAEDFIQQVYCDLLTGMVKLRPWDSAIAKAVFTSFRFTPVGGLDEIYIPPLGV